MVISKKHKYCFIEYPRSASYAIRQELIEFYDGMDWLHKHARYDDFIKSMPNDYKDFYFFCSIRNPLTDLISVYNINRTNNSGRAKEEFWKNSKWFIRYRELRRAKFFETSDDKSFQAFFMGIFKFPYIKPRIVAELKNKKYNCIIRIENLQDDFNQVLKDLNLEQKKAIRKYNVSTKIKIDIDEYYPEKIRKKAVRVLGPMMKFMGYEFPESWNITHIPISSRIYFAIMKPASVFFWKFVNYKNKRSNYDWLSMSIHHWL